MAFGDYKNLARRTASDRILRYKAINIAKSPKYDGYQRGLAPMVNEFFSKKTSYRTVKNKNISNKELYKGLQKPIIRNLKKRKVCSPFKDNILGADF